jgi:hypothetical protein
MPLIETRKQWDELAKLLMKHGYRRWQLEFDYYEPECFHAWFWSSGHAEIEVITYSKDIKQAIMEYRSLRD